MRTQCVRAIIRAAQCIVFLRHLEASKSSAARFFIILPCRERKERVVFASAKNSHTHCWGREREREIDFPSACPFSHPRREPMPCLPFKRNSAPKKKYAHPHTMNVSDNYYWAARCARTRRKLTREKTRRRL